jgi:hypothetical protein
MASTYSQYKIELIGTGEQAGTWGTTTNNNFGSATPGTYRGFEQAIGGKADHTICRHHDQLLLRLQTLMQPRTHVPFYFDLTGRSSGAAYSWKFRQFKSLISLKTVVVSR